MRAALITCETYSFANEPTGSRSNIKSSPARSLCRTTDFQSCSRHANERTEEKAYVQGEWNSVARNSNGFKRTLRSSHSIRPRPIKRIRHARIDFQRRRPRLIPTRGPSPPLPLLAPFFILAVDLSIGPNENRPRPDKKGLWLSGPLFGWLFYL